MGSFLLESVLYEGLCCLVIWVVRSGEGSSQDCPLSFLEEVLPRSTLCLFRATVVLPMWLEVCRLVGLCSGEVLPERLLALLVEVLPKATLFSMLPSPVWYVCGLWAAPGWSIPWVCLSAGVAIAVRIATLEEASARSGTTLS
ncbi:hypothetical protein Taro_020355 [Colocasia esculenta]|uniref:Uncharacterized protein n=1 Tax=Colocasia esculenta TaxID=4460 RepID=A0A843UW15_COLES|nr:hypothetical protein [Colocasia esculenta]